MVFEPFDVVIVPFPFTDSSRTKRRPALILSVASFNEKVGHSIMAMITSAKNPPWPFDVPVSELASAGLPAPSVIRMKLFTLDNRFILSKIGELATGDQKRLATILKNVLRTGVTS